MQIIEIWSFVQVDFVVVFGEIHDLVVDFLRDFFSLILGSCGFDHHQHLPTTLHPETCAKGVRWGSFPWCPILRVGRKKRNIFFTFSLTVAMEAKFFLFSRVHATLQPALSVRRSVRPSVRPSVGPSVRRSVRRSVRHTLLFCTITSTLRSF